MKALWRQLTARGLPWTYLVLSAVALIVQLNPAWRDALLYDRGAVARGEWWRLWTGHWVHFGWPHFVADAGLFLIMGWLLERTHPWFSRLALVLMPLVLPLCGGVLMLRRNEIAAGILFGLLVYKPQFGILLPFVLAAGGYWRAFVSAAATVIATIGLSIAIWGWPVSAARSFPARSSSIPARPTPAPRSSSTAANASRGSPATTC